MQERPTDRNHVKGSGQLLVEGQKGRHEMRCFWEQTGVLGPIYRALGQGLNDRDIARKLNLTEVNVQNCTDWILHFLNLRDREELVLYASAAA